ncbi:hypothetical protein ACGFKX_24285 [Pseudonocardia alni]|uniref:hypothetical protein n=1 Tax=Pseudonocardia alni TaxID=33907 RepID=UPI0037149F61
MTASTEQFVDIAKRGQDLVTESVRGWTEAASGLARQFGAGDRPQLPDAGAAVERVFDFYEQVLGHQREFARTVVGAGTSVFEQATKAAEAVTEHAGRSTEAAAEKTARATRSAAGK